MPNLNTVICRVYVRRRKNSRAKNEENLDSPSILVIYYRVKCIGGHRTCLDSSLWSLYTRYGDYTVTGSVYSSVFVWLTSQTVRMRLISSCSLSIYAGLPVNGERNTVKTKIMRMWHYCLDVWWRPTRTPSMYSPDSTPTVILGAPCSCISSITTTIYKTA